MGSGHQHGSSARHARGMVYTLGLVVAYMFVEIIGGVLANSLAILADAGHMLSDAGSLVIALIAMRIAQRPASATHTYGYRRAEVLAALANGAALVAVTGYIAYHAITRLSAPPDVQGPLMLAVAGGGLAVNLVGLYILHGGKSESLNVHGVWLHVLGDALGSVGAIVAGLLIYFLGWNWADPVASLVIALLILYSAWSLLSQTTAVLMQAVPKGVALSAVEEALTSIEGVVAVHDLHVWSVTRARAVMSAHLTIAPDADRPRLMGEIERLAREQFDVHHTTIQLDCPGDCGPDGLPPTRDS